MSVDEEVEQLAKRARDHNFNARCAISSRLEHVKDWFETAISETKSAEHCLEMIKILREPAEEGEPRG